MNPLKLAIACIVLLLPFLSATAQDSIYLRLKNPLNNNEVVLNKGDLVKLKFNDKSKDELKGTITAMDTSEIVVNDTHVPLKDIRVLMPMRQKNKVLRTASYTSFFAMLLVSRAGGQIRTELALSSVPLGLLSLALGRNQRLNLKRKWVPSVESLQDAAVAENRTVILDPTPKEKQPLEKATQPLPIAVRMDVLQFLNKEFNISLEHRIGKYTTVEYGVGLVHRSLMGQFAEQVYGLDHLTIDARGQSARIAFKNYNTNWYPHNLCYYGVEFKYRYQSVDRDNFSETINDVFTGFDYTHWREEYQVMGKLGIQSIGRGSLRGEFFIGLGGSLQQQYLGLLRENPDNSFETEEYNTTESWVIRPAYQFGLVVMIGRPGKKGS